MKYSRQRELILRSLREHADHPTAEEVYSSLKNENPSLSLGTVYRNLNLLADHGVVRKIEVSTGSNRFDATISPHGHIICSRCGKAADIQLEIPGDMAENIRLQSGFQFDPNPSEMTFYGICPQCAEKERLWKEQEAV